jgi:hypothetical protein
MKASELPATGHDILVMTIWIGALGKALVHAGALKKSDITKELVLLRHSCPPEIRLEIDNMLKVIEGW